MINFKKKNKILIILTALVISLIAIIFPFTFKNVSKNMSVMAESSTAPDITLDWFTNFSNYNKIDLHSSSIYFYSDNLKITLHCNLLDGVSFNNSSLSTNFYFKHSILINFSENVSFSFQNSSLLNILIIDIIAPSETIYSNLLILPFFIVFKYNGEFFIISSPTYEYAYDSYSSGLSGDYKDGYDAGLSAGESIGYENGYNDVMNLFTGYGPFLNASYSVYADYNNSVILSGSIGSTDTNFEKMNGGVALTATASKTIEQYVSNQTSESGYVEFTFNTPLSVKQYNTFVFNSFEFGNGAAFVLNNNKVVSFNNADLHSSLQSYSLIGYEDYNIIKIRLRFANPDYVGGIGVSVNSSNSVDYSNGFEDGKNSVNTSNYYNNGYNDGYNVGKNDGISSANNYSFLGLIGAVVDAPIKAFTGLFDFEILGFNISTFILSLITVCVIITIIKLLLGGR